MACNVVRCGVLYIVPLKEKTKEKREKKRIRRGGKEARKVVI
jgi:hypothetical protein